MKVAALGLAWLTAAWLLWVSVPRVALSPARDTAVTGTVPTPPVVRAPVRPERDLFRFVARPAPQTYDARPEPMAEVPVLPPPPSAAPETVRVLGVVRQGDRLRALLGFRGESGLVGVGERFAGYEVVGLDADTVRLRDGAGVETTLTLD